MSVNITAQDVNKLRQMTGVGIMDCKKALIEANGDFEAAVDILRKKGQKVSANRAGRDAAEGVAIALTSADGKMGVIVELNCETDFVAKNEEFGGFAHKVAELALAQKPANLEVLMNLNIDGRSISDHITDMTGKIGEKIVLSNYHVVESEGVVPYIHGNKKIAVLVAMNKGLNESIEAAGKDVAMQIAALSPVAVDKDDVDADTVKREIEIGKEQARAEGKPEEMLEKIALGKLNKFYKESTLLNQDFVKDGSVTVGKMLSNVENGLTVSSFIRTQVG
ncbi:MAG: translation elongation factor Ts [Bacteroidota bacterium]|nr:translation elongation factor Ts [Bacteroidota bacterium]MDX5430925.1 translation elongation factor Ts [Bacteroidota bacterium]MDX5469673.1 translation elongation factor Ts [Bacteroidota bacterium]